MSGVNVELDSLKRIREMLGKLQNCLNQGYSNSQSKLKEIEQKVDETIRTAKTKLNQLNRKIEDDKRTAARMQEESDRIQREIDEGKRPQEGLPYNGFILDEISRMEKQRQQLEEELRLLIQKRKGYGNEVAWFLELFGKVASGTSGGSDDNAQMQMELSKLIGNLDSYLGVKLSFNSSGGYSNTGNNYVDNELEMSMSRISLEKTRQEWHTDYICGMRVFDSPQETGATLNCNQGVTQENGGEGVEGFEGTCGLVSCENVLRMAGVDVTEAEIVQYARTHRASIFSSRNLCTTNSEPCENGGTYPQDRQAVLRHYGIESDCQNVNIEQLAEYVESGRGVIATVDANVLWYGERRSQEACHAITVTSVARNPYNNQILGFYICDSGSRSSDSARFVPIELMNRARRAGHSTWGINVTRNIIR